ncbi:MULTISPECIES: class I SAM-dependent methyltransferase [Streptomyces]|uniref:Methyltransferase n=1 Tax=Streptomyces cacaoi TaxID=1898 RepID=A0A4Y3QYU0_STRCI|nr:MULTISPECIES: class I SAM-dependent methyltransferase [Streptomyces]NNG86416.1 class I SAM-dependent methyltransferase [Streptomyces cacaoi]QHF97003.1 class I SAM-dependent methyltransferase [Streptomyces sp. NHF165]GEB50574.1 methyltransferase [Streptomyces cacaoi]
MTTDATSGVDWQGWQASWDRQQEWYLPDREERFRVMLDMVEAFAGPAPRVLDLACGTGTISARLLERLPKATAVGVDRDPALLAIARGTFAGDSRVEFRSADLNDPEWTAALPAGPFDAILTATALHWMRAAELRALYGQLAGLVREGGVFLNADHMPEEGTPRIDAAVEAHAEAQRERKKAEGQLDWGGWWRELSRDPGLREVAEERFRLFGNPAEVTHDHNSEEFPSARWHADTLCQGGFGEARTVWASPSDAMVLAVR